MAKKIREVMTDHPVTVSPGTSVREVAALMREHDVGDVLVVDGDRLLGLITDRDLVVRAVGVGRDPASTPVGEICSPDLVTVGPDDDEGRAVQLMREHAIRRLPVVADGRPLGVVSIGDLAIDRDERSALADISAAPPNR
jgi:CBS domain-containing protein